MNIDTRVSVQASELRSLRRELNLRDRALKIQATEYERRLASLNHEAEQLKDMQSRYLPREVYDGDKKSYEEWRRAVDGEIANVKGRVAASAAILAVAFSIAMILVHFWKV